MLTIKEREHLFRAFRRLNGMTEEALNNENEKLADEIAQEETAILLAIYTLDKHKLFQKERK